MADQQQPIIIKRIKKGHAGHHGGAWKVAYADFVTAMMAFFLLLWLLNAVTEEQLQGIADYFAPSTVSSSKSGAGGMLGGQVVGQGAQSSNASTPSFTLSLPPPTIGSGGDAVTDPKEGGDEGNGPGQGGDQAGQAGKGGQSAGQATQAGQGAQSGQGAQALTEKQILETNAQREQQRFDRAEETLKQAINSIPELKKLADSLMVDNTPEGLRIQIVDQDGLTMFPKGSADMYGHTRAMLDLIGRVIKQLPEKVAISGHTDSTPFATQSNYGNWELSADRALATRRMLMASGVPPGRVERVVGRADTEPLASEAANSPRNRRISIVLLRQTQPPPTVQVSPDAARAGALPDRLRAPGQALPPNPKPEGTP